MYALTSAFEVSPISSMSSVIWLGFNVSNGMDFKGPIQNVLLQGSHQFLDTQGQLRCNKGKKR
jgi:hypothetical protein